MVCPCISASDFSSTGREGGQTDKPDRLTRVHSRPTTFPITLMPLSDGLDIWTSQFSISPAGPLFNGKWFHPWPQLQQVKIDSFLLIIIIWLWPPRNVPLAKSDLFHGTFKREMVTCDNSGRLMRGLGYKWSYFSRFMERGRNWPNYEERMWEIAPIWRNQCVMKRYASSYDPAKFRKSLLSLRTA